MAEDLDKTDFLNARAHGLNLRELLSKLEEGSDGPKDITFGGMPKDLVQQLPRSIVKYWKGIPYGTHRKLPDGGEEEPITVVLAGGSRGKDGSAITEALDEAGVKNYLKFRHSDIPGILKFFKEHPTGRPVRLIGHSWGGGAVNELAKRLSKTHNILSVDMIDPVSYDRGKDVYAGARIYAPVYSNLNAYEAAVHGTLKRVGLWRDNDADDVTQYRGGHSDIKDAVRQIIAERNILGDALSKAAHVVTHNNGGAEMRNYGYRVSPMSAALMKTAAEGPSGDSRRAFTRFMDGVTLDDNDNLDGYNKEKALVLAANQVRRNKIRRLIRKVIIGGIGGASVGAPVGAAVGAYKADPGSRWSGAGTGSLKGLGYGAAGGAALGALANGISEIYRESD